MELSEMTRENTILLVCDVQEKQSPISKTINGGSHILAKILRGLEFSKIIGIPILKSEHVFKNEYKGSWGKTTMNPLHKTMTRGETHKDIQKFFDKNPSIRAKEYEKTTISMIDDEIRSEIVDNSSESLFFNMKFAVVVGLETHLAVWETCVDLKKLGIMPVILVDCVGSNPTFVFNNSIAEPDSDMCLKDMQRCGMALKTLEMWAHKLRVEEDEDGFEEILKLFF